MGHFESINMYLLVYDIVMQKMFVSFFSRSNMKQIQNVVLMAKCFTPILVQNMTHCASWMANGIWETRNVFGVVVLNYYSAAAMMPGRGTDTANNTFL